MRGRKPTPTHLKLVKGNPGKRPLKKAEPQPQGDLSEPPEWFTDSLRAGWTYAIKHAPAGLLRCLDRSALVVWVVAEDLHREAVQQVARYGMLIKTPITGQPIQSPYMAIANRQAVIMLRAAAELGFSPVSRARIALPDRPEADPSDEFFA